MSKIGAVWSDDEIAFVKTLADQNYSARQIADELTGRTRNAVIGMMHRNRIQFAPANSRKDVGYIVKQNHKTKHMKKVREALPSFNFGRLSGNKKSAPIPPQKPVNEQVAGKPKLITQLQIRDCRAILGDVKGISTLYCGKHSVVGYSWCEEHKLKYCVRRTSNA
jgi:hypothetical protein